MEKQSGSVGDRLTRFERELFFWRILGLASVLCLTLAFSAAGPEKEIRFVSTDGRQTVVLSADGLSLLNKDKTLARLGFDPVGESDKLEGTLVITGGLSAGQEGLSIRAGKDVALLSTQHLNFLEGPGMRTSLSTDGLTLSDPQNRAKITISTPAQGLGGLVVLDQQRAILSLGALGNFRGDNPPRRDVGAILLNDFGTPPARRLITPSELGTLP